MPENQQPEQGVVIASILPILTPMPDVLATARTRAARGVAAASDLVTQCKTAEKITPELDKQAEAMIVKLTKTQEDMMEIRKPYTQLIGEIVSAFTSTEKQFAPFIEELKAIRNRRAKEVAEENKRKELEAARIAAKNKEAADLAAHVTKAIGECLNNKLFSRKREMQTAFDSYTLADIEERGEKLKKFIPSFPVGKLAEIVVYTMPVYKNHTAEEVEAIRVKADRSFDWEGFYSRYEVDLDAFRQSLVARLGSKRAELQTAEDARLEKLRVENEQRIAREKQAELDRQAKATRDEAERKRLEEQQQENLRRQQELERQQAEQRRVQEQQQAEQAERQRQQEEQLKQQQAQATIDNESRAEQTRIQSHAVTLFDQTNTANLQEAEGEVRKGWEITVLEAAGWGEIMQFWFLHGGLAAAYEKDAAKVGDIDLNKMKAFAEKKAETIKIESPLLTYSQTFKAVNRAAKKKAIAQ